MADMPCAVISSTTRDLPAHRDAALDACLRQGFFPLMMEHETLSPATAAQVSRNLVDRADLYILILGFRYGAVGPGQDKSYTHLELDRAIERGIPMLVLLMGDDHPLTAADVEIGTGGERVRELRAETRGRQVVATFSSADQLRALLIDGLAALKSQFVTGAPASLHYVRQVVTPPEPYIAHPYTLLQASQVVGRQQELNALTDWVADAASRVMTFVAIGGMGKSAITWKWFNEIAPHEMRPLVGRVWWSFYESDAHFDNFVARTLAYVTGRSLDEAAEMPRADREDELLAVLDRSPYLVVLDGMERLLLAYSRADAAHVGEDDLDERTANWVIRLARAPGRAAVASGDQSRLRMTADPRVGRFLQRLAAVRASRVLATSRLYPADLETVTGEPVHGVTVYSVAGLSDDDAVNLWREFGVTGGRDELVSLFNTFGNYPLLIRALAGAVARFRQAPGDFHRWRAAHTGFDPFGLPLVQRKSHVLEYALDGLTDAESRVLYTTAAFRAPATYETLAALMVGDDKPSPDDAALDRVLSVLEDRGLMGWDRRGNRYDLHPVVRGVVWSALDPGAKQGIYQQLASHFEALPEVDDDSIKSIDDLAGAIELYHTLVRLRRATEAADIFSGRIFDPAVDDLAAYRECAELMELFVEESGLIDELRQQNHGDVALLTTYLGACHLMCGDAGRAFTAFQRFREYPIEADWGRALGSIILCALGKPADAELSVRSELNGDSANIDTLSIQALASLAFLQGQYSVVTGWLSDSRLHTDDIDYRAFFGALNVLQLGLMALHQGDVDSAQYFSDEIFEKAAADSHPLIGLHAKALGAAVAHAKGEYDQARQLLSDALVVARQTGGSDNEAGVLIQFADVNADTGRLNEARSNIADARQLAEHGQLRLRQADAMNVLSRIERLGGDRAAAASAAVEAYRLAWCDGPPFCYEWGIRQARQNLAAVGEPEPADLPAYEPIEMPELKAIPDQDDDQAPPAPSGVE
ncbi:MAG TPA: DUF4062 domain-containing protein [Trebonia sp.]|nr:DUF4062 domain-containing protein [Trebonia sp.]